MHVFRLSYSVDFSFDLVHNIQGFESEMILFEKHIIFIVCHVSFFVCLYLINVTRIPFFFCVVAYITNVLKTLFSLDHSFLLTELNAFFSN